MPKVYITCNKPERQTVSLVYTGSEHYDALEPITIAAPKMHSTGRKDKHRRPKRNQPCFCGSSRKYRDCCKKSTAGRVDVDHLVDEYKSNTIYAQRSNRFQ